jgi:hypothetical protein
LLSNPNYSTRYQNKKYAGADVRDLKILAIAIGVETITKLI